MKERSLYSLALISGIVILLAGIVLHSWLAVAAGALFAGAGGVFGALAMTNQNKDDDEKN